MKKLKHIINKLLCNLCELLEKHLYNEPTWYELQDRVDTLESKIQELEDELENMIAYRELAYREYGRL